MVQGLQVKLNIGLKDNHFHFTYHSTIYYKVTVKSKSLIILTATCNPIMSMGVAFTLHIHIQISSTTVLPYCPVIHKIIIKGI